MYTNDIETHQLVKKDVKIVEDNSSYKELQAHMNTIYTVVFSIALGFSFVIWAFDSLKEFMKEKYVILIICCAMFVIILLAVRFCLSVMKSTPLNYLSFFLFQLSKIYIIGFIYCIASLDLYVYSIALMCVDFFLISSLNLAKYTNIYLILSIIVIEKLVASIILGIFFSILSSILMVVITGTISFIYQGTIYALSKKSKFGQKDCIISTVFLYSIWLMPFGADEA